MIEDLERILNCATSQQMTEDLYLIKKIDPEMLKDGFRFLYANNHREDFEHFVKAYKSLQNMKKEEIDWLHKYLFAIL